MRFRRTPDPARTIEIVTAVARDGARRSERHCHVRNHVGLYATSDAAIDALRAIGNSPRVRDQRRRDRAELDDPSIATEIVVDREVEIRIPGDAIEDHGIADLRAGTSDNCVDFLPIDGEHKGRITALGEGFKSAHLTARLNQKMHLS
jgi:hypothetical protein